MATNQESLRRADATTRRAPLRLDLTTARWVVGIGGVLALLLLAALGAAPERQPEVSTTTDAVTDWAQRPLDGRGKWMGYTREVEPEARPARARGLLD